MRLAVINDWYSEKTAVYTNRDGFLRALQLLRDKYGWDVVFFKKGFAGVVTDHPCVELRFTQNLKEDVLAWKPDALLFFADLSRPIIKEMEDVRLPKAIAFSGGPFRDYGDLLDVLFVESAVYYDDFKARGWNVKRAFGTNTELFKPFKQPKVFDACYPATFANWKRHSLFAEAVGSRGIALGYFQPHEPHCWQVCQEKGVALLHHQNAESVNLIYNMSKTCVVTADSSGGSQRTVLEAMACNIPVIATEDSDKTTEYIRQCGVGAIVAPNPDAIKKAVDEWKDREVNTRDWILQNYSEYIYADQIKEGIEECLQK